MGMKSSAFTTEFVIKQGRNLTPLLFNLFLDDLVDVLPGSVYVGELRIKWLKFDNDIVLFAKTPETFQLLLNSLDDYCSE